jgi:predicted DNA-binding transcriptional regulator YafY
MLEALRRKAAVEMEYWARNGSQVRQISPHHVIFADGRYHVRGYCHSKADFRDFVLSRIAHAQPSALPWVSEAEDHAWHRLTDLCFAINPELPATAQDALRLDYLSKGAEVLVVKGVRQALAFYLRRHLTRPDSQYLVPRWVAR